MTAPPLRQLRNNTGKKMIYTNLQGTRTHTFSNKRKQTYRFFCFHKKNND